MMANHEESVSDGVNTGETISHVVKDEDGVKAYGRNPSGGESEHASRSEDGTISYGIRGSPPQYEDLSLQACLILVKALNAQGEEWDDPVEPEREMGVDCEAWSGDQVLKVQVVQAVTDSAIWEKLAKEDEYERESAAPKRLASDLREAIQKKAADIPESARGELTLGLNGLRTPGADLPQVVDYFRREYGDWAGSLGFSSVWLIARSVNRTARLDKGS